MGQDHIPTFSSQPQETEDVCSLTSVPCAYNDSLEVKVTHAAGTVSLALTYGQLGVFHACSFSCMPKYPENSKGLERHGQMEPEAPNDFSKLGPLLHHLPTSTRPQTGKPPDVCGLS